MQVDADAEVLAHSLTNGFQVGNALAHGCFVDDEGRQQPHHVLAGTDGEQMLVMAGADELGVGHPALEPHHQPQPAHLLDDGRMPGRKPPQSLRQMPARRLDPLEEPLAQHHVEHRVADRHGERIAAEGRAVAARRHAGRSPLGGQARPHGKTAADALGDRHDVGADAGPFVGEEPPGAAHAALHLVEHQQQAMLVAKLAQRPQVRLRQHPDAALALHRLQQDASGLRANGGPDGGEVAEGHLIEAVHLRAETVEVLLLPAGGDGGQGPAMERAFEGDQAEALGCAVRRVMLAHHLDGALQRLGSGVGEEHRLGEGRVHQPTGQPLALGRRGHAGMRALEQRAADAIGGEGSVAAEIVAHHLVVVAAE